MNEELQAKLNAVMAARKERAEQAGVQFYQSTPKVDHEEARRRAEEEIQKDAVLLERSRKNRIERSLKEWSDMVGPRFADAKIDDGRVNEIVNANIECIKAGKPAIQTGLVLTGRIGIGKTWVAYGYARRMIEEGLLLPGNLIQGTESDLLSSVVAAGYERADRTKALLNPMTHMYIIDEVGRGNYRDATSRLEIWSELVNHCYNNHITLVVTSNLSTVPVQGNEKPYPESELQKWMGEAAYDRLRYITVPVRPVGGNKRALANRLMSGQPVEEVSEIGQWEDDEDWSGESSENEVETVDADGFKVRPKKVSSSTGLTKDSSDARKAELARRRAERSQRIRRTPGDLRPNP